MYVPVNGKQAEVQLLAFDVQHDLALLRVTEPVPAQEALSFRRKDAASVQGERLYSMGNLLDIGFALTEGTYNGLVQRSFYPRIFFIPMTYRGVPDIALCCRLVRLRKGVVSIVAALQTLQFAANGSKLRS